jgi:hypothetical protein
MRGALGVVGLAVAEFLGQRMAEDMAADGGDFQRIGLSN